MVSNTFKVVGARFPISDASLLEEVCRARGEDKSDFVRRSVRKELARLSFYTEKEKKALNVPPKYLGELEEVVGILQDISNDKERIAVSFGNGTKITLSSNPQFENELKKRIGKRIGILRTGMEEKPYLIRDAEVIK